MPDNNDNEMNLLTVGDVAKLFKVTRRTIRNWIAAGKFPNVIRLGQRTVRFRADDVKRLYNQVTTPSTL
jgi:excisionase family DNA binding protein